MAMAYHVDTQAPYGTNATAMTSTGELKFGILGSDGAEDLPPDSYTIFFSTSSGVTETNSFCVTTSFGHQTNTWQYHTLSLDDLKYYFSNLADTAIYFRVRANNEANYNFSTLTQQSSITMGSTGSLWDYSQTDWSAPTGDDACDDPKVLDGVGIPQSLSTTKESDGTISLSWSANSLNYELSPTSYDIKYGYNDVFGESWVKNVTSTSDSLSRSWLETQMNLSESRAITYKFQVRARNGDTVSDYTSLSNVEIGQAPSGVGENYTLTETADGITVDWDAPTSNWVDISGYRILVAETYDQDYSANTWFEVYRSTDTSVTAFTLPWIDNNDNIEYTTLNGTYYYRISTCSSSWWCNDVESNITIDNTLGPPMNPTVENVYGSGVKVQWEQPNTGSRTATTYELYYRIDATNETVVYNITQTEYTIPYGNITNGTWTFSIRGYNSVYNVYSGYSTEPTLAVFDQKKKDDDDAEAARKQKEYEEEQARLKAIEDEKQNNYNETGYYETNTERSAREQKEYEEEQARLQAEKDKNFAETGYYELDSERADREYQEEQDRLAELQRQRDKNFSETGYSETDQERADREQAEYEAEQKRIEEEIKNTVKLPATSDGKELTKEEQEQVDQLVDTIIELKETLDLEVYEVEEEIFEIEEVVIIVPPTTTTTTIPVEPIKEDFPDELEQVEVDTPDSEDGEQEVQPTELTDEEVEILVTEVEEAITEVVEVEELTEVFEDNEIEIIEEDELEDLSEEEQEEYIEQVEEAVAQVVKDLPKEKKVEVVKEVAKVSVQNLATADTKTKAVVKAVVKEVTKVETVAELDQEEKEAVGQVLGFKENAAEDVEIIAEAASKEENIAKAVDEYVERAIQSEDVENFTLADVVTEVQVEAFLENPIGELTSVNIDLREMSVESFKSDMTTDQKEKAQEVVVPVIIASQIVAQAGALIRRF